MLQPSQVASTAQSDSSAAASSKGPAAAPVAMPVASGKPKTDNTNQHLAAHESKPLAPMDSSLPEAVSRPAASGSLSHAPAGTSANSACTIDAATDPQATDQERLIILPIDTSPAGARSQRTGSAQSPIASAVAGGATADTDAAGGAAAAAAADGIEAQSPGRRRRLGPDSTWAIRQSAELEGLQAALGKQCFRRGTQPLEHHVSDLDADIIPASAEADNAIPAQDPEDEPR